MLQAAGPRRSVTHDRHSTIPIERGARRRDVQALRGLAVLMVVVYHTGIWLPGGFVGVDVFFVVSGFVITALLLRELAATDRVRFRDFYARRARRLFPVLSVVLTVSLIGAAALLPVAGGLQHAGETVTAGAFFGANAYLYGYGGSYFTPDNENPFLHLWSLAVEEQTYLVLPAVLMMLWWIGTRRGAPRRLVAVGVAGLTAVSFVVSVAWSSGLASFGVPLADRFAFYGPVSRFWEFGAGVLVALAVPVVERSVPLARRARALGIGGIALLGVSVVSIRSSMAFPGWVALVPVAGTAAVLVAGTASTHWRDRMSWRGLVWFGDHSYGWYLWHWPAIVLAAVWWPGRTEMAVAAAVVALALAVAGRARLEDRFRYDMGIVGRRAVALSAVCLLVPAALGVAVREAADRGWWLDDVQVAVAAQTPTRADAAACNSTVRTAPCEFVGPPDAATGAGMNASGPRRRPTALLIGDSHAGAIADAFVAAAHANSIDAAVWTRGNCAPFVGVGVTGVSGCSGWTDDVVRWVREHDVEIVAVHTSRAYAEPGRLRDASGRSTTDVDTARRAFVDGVRNLAAAVAGHGTEVLVVTGVPTFDGSQIEHTSLSRRDPEPQSLTVAEFVAGADPLDAGLRRLAREQSNVSVVDVWPAVCEVSSCSQRDAAGVWRYRDWHHLSLDGAALTVPALEAALGRLR